MVRVLRDFARTEDELAAGWLHDVIEDTPVSREAIVKAFGAHIGELVWACTGEGGARAEHNAVIYRKIAAYPQAAVIKLADRIANVEASPAASHHRARYRGERPGFGAAVAPLVPPAMWARLERAYDAWP